MAAPLIRQLPDYSGKNFAPVKPFTKLEEKQGEKSPFAQHYITDAIRKKYEQKVKDNELAWKEMILAGQLVALFIQGKQLLQFNPYTNQYTVAKGSRNDPSKVRSINLMQYFATNWEAKWCSSNPDVYVEALSNSDVEISKARKANVLINHLERNMYDVWYNRHEGLMAQCFGWYGSRVRPCRKEGKMIMRDVVEDREVAIGNGFFKCHDCPATGPGPVNEVQIAEGQTMPACPRCGSPAIFYEPPPQQIIPQVVGEEPFLLPKIISEQLPFPACRWDARYRMEDSDWFLYEQEMTESAIRRSLGNIRLPSGESFNSMGLEVVRELAAMGTSVGGRGGGPASKSQQDSMATVSELYLGLDDLWDIQIEGDEETFAGINLPRGTRLSEFVEQMGYDAACFIGVNGFALMSGMFLGGHKETHTSGVYHMKPMSGTGRGVIDAVELQKRFNKLDSQALRHMQAQATPATLHVEGAIPPNQRHLLGQPGVDIPVSIQNFPEINDIRKLVAPLQGTPVSGDLFQYNYQHLNNFMQLAYHITNFSGGLNPRVKNDTATGAEILDANAEEVFQPLLETKADTRTKNVRKAFGLWCKVNAEHSQFVPLKKKASSGVRGLDISGKDVEGEYEWQVVPGSELPKNRLTRRRDMATFYAQFGGAPGYFQLKATGQFSQELTEIERAFDMDFQTDNFDDIGELCRLRFERGLELLGQANELRGRVGQQFGVMVPEPNPMFILPEIQPSMLVTEPSHDQKALWFARLLDTPEGQEMSPEERGLVSAFIEGHMMLAQGQAIAIQQGLAETQLAGQAPMMDAQFGQDQAAADAQAQRDAANQPPPPEEPDQDAEAARQLAMGDVEHGRQMELEDKQHEHAMELEKVRRDARQKTDTVKGP